MSRGLEATERAHPLFAIGALGTHADGVFTLHRIAAEPVTRCGRGRLAALIVLLSAGGSALAGPADVLAASADCSGSVCRFLVTVRHDDEGWKHYANAWEIVAPDGSVLATRVLRHPHVGEQPFTRALGGVELPPGITSVRIRARDSVHAFGGKEVSVTLGD
jgi:hypothetical protein